MALRRFIDATGTKWEAFHVRWKSADEGTTRTLGSGWLSFVSATEKRRSEHVPEGWAALSDAELERICAGAQVVRSVRDIAPLKQNVGAAQSVEPAPGDGEQQSRRSGGPRIIARTPPLGDVPASPPAEPARTEEVVRTLARAAREQRIPVLDAAAQLKRELSDRGEAMTPEALKTARRWFIDTFYFGDKGSSA